MTLWIDFLLFGNGRGLAAPRHDQRFYWLGGRLYTWIGGYGAQLQSIEWRCPRPGERRLIAGTEWSPFGVHRRWCKWRVSWVEVGFDGTREQILEIEKRITV